MKKFLTVLAIALIAMTSVFAAAGTSVGSKDLKLTLEVGAETTVGFTGTDLGDSAISLTPMTEFEVNANTSYSDKIYASFVSTDSSKLKIEVSVDKPLTHTTATDETIETTIECEPYSESSLPTGQRSYSHLVKLTIGSASGKLAGSYEGNLKMTVTTID